MDTINLQTNQKLKLTDMNEAKLRELEVVMSRASSDI